METKFNSLYTILTNTVCLRSAESVMELLCDDSITKEFKDIDEFFNYIKNTDFNISMIGIYVSSVKTFDDDARDELIKKYNLNTNSTERYIMKQEKLRVFDHVFNLFKFGDEISLGQSWVKNFNYCIIKQKGDVNSFIDKFLKKLRFGLESCSTDLYIIDRAFGVKKSWKNKLDNLNKMMQQEKFELEYVFTVEHNR